MCCCLNYHNRLQGVVRPDENGQFPAGTATETLRLSGGNSLEMSASEIDLITKLIRDNDFNKMFEKIVKEKGVEASKQFYENVMDQIPDDRTKTIINILIDQNIVKNIQGNR